MMSLFATIVALVTPVLGKIRGILSVVLTDIGVPLTVDMLGKVCKFFCLSQEIQPRWIILGH
ncbi:hypothetical protein Plhal304r1_c058g0145021 [Plasmopara halstedii]